MTQEEFGKKFGIVKSTVSLYESGKSTPNDQIKKQICNYFHVSLDYLLGNTDMKQCNNYNFHDFFVSFFFGYWDKCQIKIYERMKELSISKSDLINETNIDYPVVQSSDNDYYLKHNLYNETDKNGWIYMDYRNSSYEMDANTIIFGHNMYYSGIMFGTLANAYKKSWYSNPENQIIFNISYNSP